MKNQFEIINEVVCKVNQDSFRVIEYWEPNYGTISMGFVSQIGNNKYNLEVNCQSIISLNTGQIIKPFTSVQNISFELSYDQESLYILSKKINNRTDSTFESKPFNIINKLTYVESRLINEPINSPLHKSQNKIPPSKPYGVKDKILKEEIDSLNHQRNQNIKTLINHIAKLCDIKKEDKVILQIHVNLNGQIDEYKIQREQILDKTKLDCLDEIVSDSKLNLGIIKIIPNARNGFKPSPVFYTLPINE